MAVRLNNTQKATIQKLVGKEKTIEEIAQEMGIPEKTIKDYLDSLSTSIQKILSNQTAVEEFGIAGGDRDAAVMTEIAAQKVDDARQRPTPRTKKDHLINIKTGKPYE